jgi:hypothetical protein
MSPLLRRCPSVSQSPNVGDAGTTGTKASPENAGDEGDEGGKSTIKKVVSAIAPSSTSHGLAALALISFAAAFFGARLFATLNPKTVVETGGIHFHHFWYGLIMVLAAGWLGIASKPSIYRRIYAIIFGLGVGLIGDEVGLLLTFGNYFAEPTYVVFIGAVCVAAVAVLIFGFKKQVSYDVLTLKRAEQLLYVGVIVSGLSALAFSVGQLGVGVAILAVGILIAAVGIWLHRRETASLE